jgi:hypothetical protein
VSSWSNATGNVVQLISIVRTIDDGLSAASDRY